MHSSLQNFVAVVSFPMSLWIYTFVCLFVSFSLCFNGISGGMKLRSVFNLPSLTRSSSPCLDMISTVLYCLPRHSHNDGDDDKTVVQIL